MKLVTYDDGKVGRIDGEEIVRLDVPTMREYFERGGADDASERTPLADAKLQRADRPEEVLPHRRQLPRARGGVEERQLVARDRAVDRLLPERRRDHRHGRARRLSRAPHRGARLRARARGDHRQGRQVVRPRGGDGLRRRLRHLQRHHRARHPAAGDAKRRLLVLQGDRHVLPARPVDRHRGRDPGSARSRDDVARERRDAPDVAFEPHVDDDSGDSQPLLAARVLGRRRSLDGYRQRRGGVQRGRRVALPEAGRRDRGGDRADRRAPQSGDLLAGRRTASRRPSGCAGEAQGVHHRDHGPGRLLSRGDPAREGLRGLRHGAAFQHVQHRAHRPHLRRHRARVRRPRPTARRSTSSCARSVPTRSTTSARRATCA